MKPIYLPQNNIQVQTFLSKIIKCKTRQDVKDLQKDLRQFEANTIALDCLILALIQRTGRENIDISNEVKCELLNVIKTVLEIQRKIHKKIGASQLKVITIILLEQVFDFKSSIMRSGLSEEYKLSIVECLTTALHNTSSDGLETFYAKGNAVLPQMVFVTVNLIQMETYRKLRLTAMECLMSVFQVNDTVDFSDICFRKDVADIMFLMLPKVVATLQKVIHGEDTQGHIIISTAIQALGRILCLIFEDYEKEIHSNVTLDDFRKLITDNSRIKVSDKKSNDVLGDFKNHKTIDEKSKYLEAIVRSPEWIQQAFKRLQSTMKNLTKLIGNRNVRIRFEMATLCCNLIEKCSASIVADMTPLLEATIALSQDNNIEIAQLCQNTLKNRHNTNFTHQLECILMSHVARIQSIIYSGDEDEQLAALQLLKGVLQYLAGKSLKIILTCPDTMEQFVHVLLFIGELDRPLDLLHEEHALRSVEDPMATLKLPWKQFKNLQNQSLVQCFSEICQILGRSAAADLIFNHSMEFFASSTMHCNQLLVLFQFMLAIDGWGEVARCSDCLEELMSNKHWDLDVRANQTTSLEMVEFGESDWYESRTEGLYESAVSIRYTDMQWKGDVVDTDPADSRLNINEAKFNVQHICLVLETIGLFSVAMKNVFQPFVLRSLHRILEKTGSSNYAIHLAGARALQDIRSALNCDSVAQLIHNNADYISYFVNLSLKKVNESNQALDVLSVVLKYSSMKSIPHLENIIDTVMAESAKPQQSHNISAFLRVFHMILTSISNWTPAELSSPTVVVPVLDDETELRHTWLNMLEEPEIEDLVADESDEEDRDHLNEEAPTEVEVPSHIQITVNILKRCIKYISLRNKMDKCLVLDTLCAGLEVLAPHTNELLSTVHALWQPFVERLKDRDAVVLRKCFLLLVVLGRLAKDFLYKRTTKDLFQFMIQYLCVSCTESLKRRSDPSYEKTQQFKFICELLKELPGLLINLEVRETDLNQMLDVTSPYLHRDQHPILQENARNFMNNLLPFDGAAVFIKLKQWLDNEQYKDNVTLIFKDLLTNFKK